VEFTGSNHLFGGHASSDLPLMENALPAKCPSILRLNQALDSVGTPSLFNEQAIEDFLQDLEATGRIEQPEFWLLTARLFELALFCAGHYADNGEFTAAGDLLVNPRKVLIHRKGHPQSLVKQRHGRLSDQLNKNEWCREPFFLLVKREVIVEIAKPAILPYLFEQMRHSQKMAPWYLHSAGQRMQKIADTIGFLAVWSVSGFEDLHQRLGEASPQTGRFVGDHLCRFDTHYFNRLGREIKNFMENADGSCEFLAD
jgi:hypothetical protein